MNNRCALSLAFVAALVSLPVTPFAQTTETPGASQPRLNSAPAPVADYGKLPLSFEANRGQADPAVKFLSRGKGYALYLTDRAAVLALAEGGADSRRDQMRPGAPGKTVPGSSRGRTTDVVRMELAGSAQSKGDPVSITGDELLPGTANYFIGNDAAQWQTNLPTYGKVKYAAVYPGVDLIYYGNQQQLEYDFVIAPGATSDSIRLHFAGATRLKINTNGDLSITAGKSGVVFQKPVIYQVANGQREKVNGSFQLLAGNNIRFRLGRYDHTRELVIDPTLVYSTCLGGPHGGNYAYAVAVDSSGNTYLTGATYSPDFPVTSGSYQVKFNAKADVFVTKLNPAGSALVYSTYLGESNTSTENIAYGIAVDKDGNAYVTGNDNNYFNPSFPVTSGAFQTACESESACAFVTKLNSTGSALVYSTYLGGNNGTDGRAIALDSAGDAFVTGATGSTDFPVTSNAFQKTISMDVVNAFVTKFNPSGSSLIYSTYLGGTVTVVNGGEYGADDFANGIAVDAAGNAYVAGQASSKNFPTSANAFQKVNNCFPQSNAFVSKLNPSGSALVYSSYLGGESYADAYPCDGANGIAIDASGDAYVTGAAASRNFPVTADAFQKVNNNIDHDVNAFVTEFNPTGSGLVYSTYLGGSGADESNYYSNFIGDIGYGIAVDSAGHAYVTGYATSQDFPVTSDAYQPNNGTSSNQNGVNAFITEFNTTGSGLEYSSYFGGSGNIDNDDGVYISGDEGFAITLDASDNAYLVGSASSPNFPTTSGAFQPAATYTSGFVAKFAFGSGTATATITNLTTSINPQKAGANLTFTASVTPSSGSGIPTGEIKFTIDGGTPTEVALASGVAKYITSISAAGKHTIQAVYGGDASYASSNDSIVETIIGGPTSVTVVSGSGQSAMYGISFNKPLVVLVTDTNGIALPGVVVTFSGPGVIFSGTTATTAANGEVSVTAKADGNGVLTAKASVSGVSTPASFTLTGTKAPLVVSAKSVTILYDAAIPALTYKVTGYRNGDTSSVLSGQPDESTTATQGSPVGKYPIDISQGTLSATNYSFQFADGTLTIDNLGPAKIPTFSPAHGSYGSAQSVKLSDTTPGAVIYYTTDDSTPTTASTPYTGAIAVSSTETIKAIATAPGYTTSGVGTAVFTIE